MCKICKVDSCKLPAWARRFDELGMGGTVGTYRGVGLYHGGHGDCGIPAESWSFHIGADGVPEAPIITFATLKDAVCAIDLLSRALNVGRETADYHSVIALKEHDCN